MTDSCEGRGLIRKLIRGLMTCVDVLLPAMEVAGDRAARECGWVADELGAYCHRCGVSVGEGEATKSGCGRCRDEYVVWDEVYRLGGYTKPLSEWVVRMKFHQMWQWARWFGTRLAEVVDDDDKDKCVIIAPVPLHWRRRVRRGYDQSALIARSLARAKDCRFVRLIRRRRATEPQSGIKSVSKRAANVRGAFALRGSMKLAGRTVWLVDDVKTTGATAGQCARLLKKAGAARVILVVVTVADGRSGGFGGG